MLRVCGVRAVGPTCFGSVPKEGDLRKILVSSPLNEDMAERKLPT